MEVEGVDWSLNKRVSCVPRRRLAADLCLLNVTTCQIYPKSLHNPGKFTVYQDLCESHALAECRLYYSVLGDCSCLNAKAAKPSPRWFLRLYSNPTGCGIIYLQTNHHT